MKLTSEEIIEGECSVINSELNSIAIQLDTLEQQKRELHERRSKIEQSLYIKNIFLTHIREIFRLAKIQFSRLNRNITETLTDRDVAELNKWIGRAKSEQGLKDIVDALNELTKYNPDQVKNIYALCQKIISGGAYNKNKLKKA
jgi:hypothetical protein